MESSHTRKDMPAMPYPLELSYVIPVYFDQEDQESLHELLRKYSEYDPVLLDRIQFVIVDDCSPLPVNLPDQMDMNILLLRIEEDILWNQGGARNLGVVYGRSDKILATDLDHEFTEETLKHLINFPKLDRTIFRFHRLDREGRFTKSHPNTFFMSRGRFLRFFGVDEEFSGAYGCEDGMFWRWQRYNGTRFRYMNKKYASRLRKLNLDKSYHSLTRDVKRNTDLKNRKKDEWKTWGPLGGHSRKFLAFTWSVVEDRKRSHLTWKPPKNRMWKKLWLFRQILG